MEGHLPQGGMVPGGGVSYGGLDLQNSVRPNSHSHNHNHNHNHNHQHHQHHQHPIHHAIGEGFPLTMELVHTCGGQSFKNNSASEEDEPSLNEEGNRGKKGSSMSSSQWHRVKWTDKMVKLLITAVSYIGDDSNTPDCSGGRRKSAVLQKKGKWKSVSKVMAERGYHVSPQQCEDKFNDLNKRYKRLNDMLGRGTSCQVVENPSLLDVIDYLNDKEKDDVRKILSSKHLFYEEMCSYHNGNRLHLPHDPALQRSLQLALRSREDHHHENVDEDDHDAETDDHDELEEHNGGRAMYGMLGDSGKRFRQQSQQDVGFVHSLSVQQQLGQAQAEMNQALPDNSRVTWLQKQWVESRSLQLEERKLQIQVETLELEKQRLKWERFSKKRERELEKLRMENERMKLENERMALELKRKEMGAGL